jgi:hypothetical protein
MKIRKPKQQNSSREYFSAICYVAVPTSFMTSGEILHLRNICYSMLRNRMYAFSYGLLCKFKATELFLEERQHKNLT